MRTPFLLTGGDGTFLLDSGLAKVSVMELVHNGFLYPRETKAVSVLRDQHELHAVLVDFALILLKQKNHEPF